MSGAVASKTGTGAALALGLSLSLVLGRATPASARAGGIAADTCDACHGRSDSGPPALSLSPEPATFNPGDLVTFTLSIRAANAKVGGAFINSGGIGTLRSLAGEGLKVNGQGLTHSAPKTAVNGAVSFRFEWQAPSKPGGLDIRVAALAGNANNSPAGDAPGAADFQWVFGCSARTFYLDLDRDGYGAKNLGTLLGCAGDAAPTGFAVTDGDCDENDEKVHPGATEVCNRTDDNCDSQIDEGSSPVTMWPDKDGDGYYGAQAGTSKIGCGDVAGYAVQAGDCNDADAAIHPRAPELCNVRDDNCDGQVDELVRPRCGLGWCARLSLSCSAADCQPGPPMAETCNDFDDDCDGEIDNGACPAGYACAGEACVPNEQTGGTAGGSAAGAGAGGPASSGVGGSLVQAPSAGTANGTGPLREGGCAVAGSLRHPAESAPCYRWGLATLTCVGCLAVGLIRRRKRGGEPWSRTLIEAGSNDCAGGFRATRRTASALPASSNETLESSNANAGQDRTDLAAVETEIRLGRAHDLRDREQGAAQVLAGEVEVRVACQSSAGFADQ